MQLKDKTVRDVALRCRWVNVSSLFPVSGLLFDMIILKHANDISFLKPYPNKQIMS